VCLTRRMLDSQIAAGRPYGLSPVLLLRAAQLTHPRTRRRVARKLRRLVDYADRLGPRPHVARFVLDRAGLSVMAGREAFLGLAERLEGGAPVCPKGVVLARGLLNGASRRELGDPHLGRGIAERVWDVADVLVWADARSLGLDGVGDQPVSPLPAS
jgi:hypothetical protein